MITDIIGAVVGSKLDQRDGDSGAKGALIGYFTPRAIGAAAKVGLMAVIGYRVVQAVQSLTSKEMRHRTEASISSAVSSYL